MKRTDAEPISSFAYIPKKVPFIVNGESKFESEYHQDERETSPARSPLYEQAALSIRVDLAQLFPCGRTVPEKKAIGACADAIGIIMHTMGHFSHLFL